MSRDRNSHFYRQEKLPARHQSRDYRGFPHLFPLFLGQKQPNFRATKHVQFPQLVRCPRDCVCQFRAQRRISDETPAKSGGTKQLLLEQRRQLLGGGIDAEERAVEDFASSERTKRSRCIVDVDVECHFGRSFEKGGGGGVGSLGTRGEQRNGDLKMRDPNETHCAEKIVFPAGVDAETVGLGTQEERFFACVVVETEIVAEGIDHHDPTIAPIPHDAVAAAPGDRLWREICVRVEFQELEMTSSCHRHFSVEGCCDDGDPAVFGRAGEKLPVGGECHRMETTAESIVHFQVL